MPIIEALFSFQGRMCRLHYMLNKLIFLVPLWIFHYILASVATTDIERIVSLIVIPILLWPELALITKRLHDCNRSGWYVLISLIPILGPIILLIEVLFVRGTIGPNRFGDDPIQEAAY